MSGARVVVLTKAPVPGRVKTRLQDLVGAEGAAKLHRALVDEALMRVRASGLDATVALADDVDDAFASELLDRGWSVERQVEGDLGARMRHALHGPERRVLIGTDIPLFEPAWLVRAARSTAPVVLGPAEDGGYWLIGADRPLEILFTDMPWSTPDVLRLTLERAAAAGLRTDLLPTTFDIDEPDDLDRLIGDPRCPPALRRLLGALGFPRGSALA